MNKKINSLLLNVLTMAVWRRKPKQAVIVHSDQGSHYTSSDWQNFLKSHNLTCSMSRRGNCYENAVAESFFQLLKRESYFKNTKAIDGTLAGILTIVLLVSLSPQE